MPLGRAGNFLGGALGSALRIQGPARTAAGAAGMTAMGTAMNIGRSPAGRSAAYGAGIGAIGGGIYGGLSDRGSVLGGAFGGAWRGAALGGGGRMAWGAFGRPAMKNYRAMTAGYGMGMGYTAPVAARAAARGAATQMYRGSTILANRAGNRIKGLWQ